MVTYFKTKSALTYNLTGVSKKRYSFFSNEMTAVEDSRDIAHFRSLVDTLVEVSVDRNAREVDSKIETTARPLSSQVFKKVVSQEAFVQEAPKHVEPKVESKPKAEVKLPKKDKEEAKEIK